MLRTLNFHNNYINGNLYWNATSFDEVYEAYFMHSAFTSITTQQTQTVALSTVVIFYYASLNISLDITFREQRVSTCT